MQVRGENKKISGIITEDLQPNYLKRKISLFEPVIIVLAVVIFIISRLSGY